MVRASRRSGCDKTARDSDYISAAVRQLDCPRTTHNTEVPMQNQQLIDLYRNGVKAAADVTRMSIENGIKLQEKQLEIARNILNEQSRTADEISRASSMEELLSVQSRLASAQLGRMVELWSTMWQTAAQNQSQGFRDWQAFATRSAEDVARSAADQVSRAAGSVSESADAANHERKGQQRRSA
jgi:hypothetical protein